MEAFLSLEKRILYPYFKGDPDVEDSTDNITRLLELVAIGSYVEVLKDDLCQTLLKECHDFENLNESYSQQIKDKMEEYLERPDHEKQFTVFAIGIACLQLFCQNNFTGPLIGPDPLGLLYHTDDEIISKKIKAMSFDELLLDTEGVYSLLAGPEYLLIARVILYELKSLISVSNSIEWWCCRYNFIHQKIADEKSPLIHNSITESAAATEGSQLFEGLFGKELLALFNLEIGHIHLYYYYVNLARLNFNKAKEIFNVVVSMSGALGKRTKWQQNDIPQLVLKLEYKDHSITESEQVDVRDTFLGTDLPKDVLLTDDTRLNSIKYKDEDEGIVPNLQPIEQAYLLAGFFLMSKSSAHDTQLEEEMKVYLHSLLQHPKNWSIQIAALLNRSRIEASESRAMERSMTQLEELVAAISRTEPSRFERMKLIYATHLMPQWSLQQELARMYMRLGCIKTALSVFERIHLWEDVIACYNELQMKGRAADIIRNLLEKGETPKLWCLLGEATDDVECFNKSWELSNHKSGRAQRCLGNYYYVRKEYKKAIPYYEMSVEINTLQFQVWQRLAFAALQEEDWERCSKAYRRCSLLEPDSFESWNNMSQAYLKLNQPLRAWKCLQEALRCNMANWRLWANYMLVSTNLGYMNQAINAYNSILQHKEKHVDTDVLGRIVKAVKNEAKDPDGNNMGDLHKKCTKLLAKLSNEIPTNSEMWFLYGDMVYSMKDGTQETKHIAMRHYRKSVAIETQKARWETKPDDVVLVLMRTFRMLEVVHEVAEGADPASILTELNSIRMLIRNIIILIKNTHTDFITNEIIASLKTIFGQAEEELDKLLALIDKIKSI